MKMYAYTDGASYGNPGRSASGYLILDGSHKPIAKQVFYNGVCTNNVAEYKAVIAALRKMLELFGDDAELTLVSDSKLVINQLLGKYKIKNQNLKVLNDEAQGLLASFDSYKLRNVRRENSYIKLVDKELGLFLDGKGSEWR